MAASSIPERPEHAAVVKLLRALDGPALSRHGVTFAGGTRIALAYGEYRVSRDVDFLAVDRHGYASLRAEVRERGVAILFVPGADVQLPREARMDQYGIRLPVVVAGEKLKVEFIAEGRVELDRGQPGLYSDVPWATVLDCFVEKILANSDRWADDAYLSRDLIDLGALTLHEGPIPEAAWLKAEGAYGPTAARDLERAAERFVEREDHQQRCFERLDVRGREELLESIRSLQQMASARVK